MDTRIYVATHKESSKPDGGVYRMLHVGREGKPDLGYEGDNTGENISSRNANYSELTGLYWIWKNVKCDIVGLCHYRRYFVREEDFLDQEYVENILIDYDMILPHSAETEYSNNREHYEKVHVIEDMNTCKKVLEDMYPEYIPAYDLFMDTNLASLANMVITKKEIFDEYCEFLFSVLFEIEKRVDISNYDEYQSRIYGFISERLLRIWVFMHGYRVKEEEVRMIDPQDSQNAQKIMSLRHRILELILGDLTKSYKEGRPYDIVDNCPLDIDFKGKIPVWICWWQGLDSAPDIVKACVKSIQKNIPVDKAKIHIITFDNVGDYIALPTWIIDKFDSGAITYTHLSDILRVALLSRYGGFWMDATYYMVRPLPETVFDSEEFYTCKNPKLFWKVDITKSRWAGNFMRGGAGNILFRYMLNAFYEYWDTKDELIDYFLIDHVIDLAYDEIPEVKEMIDGCVYSQPQVHELAKVLNKKYSEELFNEITKDTDVFKLSYKHELYAENLLGNKTFYGHLLEMSGV